MPKLSYSSATFLLNCGKNRILVVNGHSIMDSAFIFAGAYFEDSIRDGLKTSFHIRDMKLIGFTEIENRSRIIAIKAFDGIDFGRYGEARLYEEISWMKDAVSHPRENLKKELRKALSREGNRYLREQFIKQGEK
jgi:hypothetical protein